ncbi:suppressor of fused domain protein [Rhodopirellula sp. JC639]|uniref:suppressor of fused domain protein n=1 Tax=Stieleria mannarensis TaxID=2755585 RepID=UPI001602FD95|nr:suppressor of fused domain protein [Rhodopirellula sp. JC639]
MPDPQSPGQWYIKTTNGMRGPYPIEKLQRYVDAGAILPNAGLRDGKGPWVAAATVQGLTFPAESIAKLRAAHRTAAPGADQAAANPQRAAQSPTDDAPDQTRGDEDHQRRIAELTQREQTLEGLAKTLDARGSELDARDSELERREVELRARQEELESKGNELESLREELQSQRGELESQRERLESQSAEQTALLKDQQQTLADDRSQLAQQQAECEARRDELEQRESQLAARSAEVQQAESQLTAEREEIDGRTQQLDQREQELDQREQELVEREQAVDRKQASLEEQATSQAERESEIDGRHAEVSDATAESILSEKRKLLQEFAARQASLSQREADLMRREDELTRRELDITVRPGASVIPEPTAQPEPQHDQATPEQAAPEQAAPEQAAPEQAAPEQAAPEQAAPEQAAPEQADVSSIDVVSADASPPAAIDQDNAAEPAVERPDESMAADAAPASWEDVLGRTDERADAYELAVNDAPRYGPVTSQDQHQLSETVGPDEDPVDADDGASSGAQLDDPPTHHEDLPESDVPRRDRLPSEILPSELPHYDGVSQAAESEGNVAVAAGVPATDAELNRLRRAAFEERFGPCCRYDVDDDPTMRVDVSVHSPEGNRDFMTLVTSGMSDYPIPMPNGQRSVRAELLLYVTHLDDLAIQIVRGAAKEPYRKKKGLSIGTTGSLEGLHDLMPDSQQKDCVYMLPVIESDSKPIQTEAGIGGVIQLFWLMTITEAERKLIDTGGIHKFLSLLEKNSHAVFFDPMRECYVKRKRWFRR